MAGRTARQKAASRKNLIQARKKKGGKGISGGITHDAPGKVRQPLRSGLYTKGANFTPSGSSFGVRVSS